MVLTIAALFYQDRFHAASDQRTLTLPRLVFVIPAHNEAEEISACVANVLVSVSRTQGCQVVVIADNCTDDTALIAAQAGARVLVRQNAEKRGKGYALDYAFSTLMSEPFDGFVVIDADSRVDEDLVLAFQYALSQGENALQCRYRVANPDLSARARLQHIAWLAFNELRLKGRDRLNLSVGILGNGFALSRTALESVPYLAGSIAEDMEYHLSLVRAGFKVRYLSAVTVYSDVPSLADNAAVQRSRWEGGRFRIMREHIPQLFKNVCRGHILLLEPLLELLLLPLAFHIILLLMCLPIPYAALQVYAASALTLVTVHVFVAIYLGGGGWTDVMALVRVPFYIVWKLALVPKLWINARTDASWQRTGRE